MNAPFLRESPLIVTKPKPQDLQSYRERALSVFAKASLPNSRKEESWRKIQIERSFHPESYSIAHSRSEIEIEAPPGALDILSFEEACAKEEYGKRIFAHLEQSLNESSDYFAWENIANWMQSLFIYCRHSIHSPIVLRHHIQKGNVLVHRILFCLAPNAEATFIEHFSHKAKEESPACYWNAQSTALLAPNARLSYVSLRDLGAQDHHFLGFFCEQERDSHLFTGLAHCGGLAGKGFIRSRLLQKNTGFRSAGLYAGMARQRHDIEMLAEHYAEHSSSSLLYKAVLREQAHSIFDGKLEIKAGIKAVTSHQHNHNILMDPSARAESMPRLLVQAEEVSCEHGATVGGIDPEAIFYLLTRGLCERDARYLIIEGFLNEVIHEFPLSEEQRQKEVAEPLKKKLHL